MAPITIPECSVCKRPATKTIRVEHKPAGILYGVPVPWVGEVRHCDSPRCCYAIDCWLGLRLWYQNQPVQARNT